ncbi:MAG: hypothetical protein ING19_02835 [Azospirillum sp.]|nr:hypothetical protein [Azospirillum sp.]
MIEHAHAQQQQQQQTTAASSITAPAQATPAGLQATLLVAAAASLALLAHQIATKAITFYGDVVTRAEAAERAREWATFTAQPIALTAYSAGAERREAIAGVANRFLGVDLSAAAARAGAVAAGASFTELLDDLQVAGMTEADAAVIAAHARQNSARMCRMPVRDGNVADGDRVRVTTSGGAIPPGAQGLQFEFDLAALSRFIPVPCGATVKIAAVTDGRGGDVVLDVAGRRANVLKINESLEFKVR